MRYKLIPEPKNIVYYDNSFTLNRNSIYIVGNRSIMERLKVALNDFCSDVYKFCNIVILQKMSVSNCEEQINLIIDKNSGIKKEGYILDITHDGIFIKATEYSGLYYGLQTLMQIFKQSGKDSLRCVHIEDEPDLEIRAMMLDLRMQTYKIEYILEFVKTLSHYKVNTLTIEYSNKFPYWGEYEVIRDIDCFSEQEIERLVQYCYDHFVDIIPFVQCFGHMEYILRTDKFRYLRENDDFDSQICPLHPDSLKVIQDLLQQMMSYHKYSTRISIGGDEPYHLGECKRCADFAEKYGKGGLFVHHINELCKVVKAMGLTPLVCADKLLAYPSVIDQVDKDYIIIDWDYWTYNDNPTKVMNWDALKMMEKDEINFASPEMKKFIESVALDERGNLIPFPYTKYFSEIGFDVVGVCSTASVGPDCYWVPQYRVHIPNISAFCRNVKRYGGIGVINTAWERFLFELTYYGIIYCAEQCWTTPDGEIKQFNERFVNLFFGIDDTELIEWFYKISQSFSIVEKKYPKVYKLEEYGRVDMTVAEISKNDKLKHNIKRSLEVYEENIDKVKWNSYNLKEWVLGAKVKLFWFEVTRCYAEAASNPENDKLIKENIEYLDNQLKDLREEIISLLSTTMPEYSLKIKSTVYFELYEQLKDEMLKKDFKH